MKKKGRESQTFTRKGGRCSGGYPPAEGRVEHSKRNSSQEHYIIFSLERERQEKTRRMRRRRQNEEEEEGRKKAGREGKERRKYTEKRRVRGRREMHTQPTHTQHSEQLLFSLKGLFCSSGCSRWVEFIQHPSCRSIIGYFSGSDAFTSPSREKQTGRDKQEDPVCSEMYRPLVAAAETAASFGL